MRPETEIFYRHQVQDWSLQRYLINRYIRWVRVDAPPIFIVGCGHSGTSLLLAILGTHSRICAIPFESYLVQKFTDRQAAYLRAFDQLAIATGKHRWVEKTPRHIRNIDQLLKIHPRARIIVMLRDGRDVATSIFKRTGDLSAGIDRWISDNRAAEQFLDHPRVQRFRYEDIVADFRSALSNILSFTGEEYESQLSHFDQKERHYYSSNISRPPDQTEKNHMQFRNWQINQPLFDGRGQWKSLSAKQQQVVLDAMRIQLSDYGYLNSIQ